LAQQETIQAKHEQVKAIWPLSLKSAADKSPYHGKGFIYLVTPEYVYFLVSSFNGENIPAKLHVTPHLFVIDIKG
jgi:hypothetical protein